MVSNFDSYAWAVGKSSLSFVARHLASNAARSYDMKPTGLHPAPFSKANVNLDADEFAVVAGGRWETTPPKDWVYKGLCYVWTNYLPGRMVICGRPSGFHYGLSPSGLHGTMGSAGVILENGAQSPNRLVPIFRVDSIEQAIQRIATHHRSLFLSPIFAVTGSVGKSSSCRLLRHLLSHTGRVGSNDGYNYPEGILCEMGNLREVDYFVIEASQHSLGIATSLLKPNVALLTQVSPVHIAGGLDLLALTEKKASLFKDLAPNGTAVINRDIEHFDRAMMIANESAATVLTFGEHQEADFRLVGYDAQRQLVRAKIFSEDIDFKLGLRGHHMAVNSLGALAALHGAGVAWKPLLAHCESVKPVKGRGSEVEYLKLCGVHVLLIDDSFNASPASMKAAFANLASTTPKGIGRRVAVLADMLELGDESPSFHEQLREPLLESGVQKVYLAGEMMKYLWDQLPSEVRQLRTEKAGDLLRSLASNLRDGDVILVKGSNGTQVHRLVRDLRYLTLFRHFGKAGLPLFFFVKGGIQWIAPHVPTAIWRWTAWQVRKLAERGRRPTAFH